MSYNFFVASSAFQSALAIWSLADRCCSRFSAKGLSLYATFRTVFHSEWQDKLSLPIFKATCKQNGKLSHYHSLNFSFWGSLLHIFSFLSCFLNEYWCYLTFKCQNPFEWLLLWTLQPYTICEWLIYIRIKRYISWCTARLMNSFYYSYHLPTPMKINFQLATSILRRR